MYYNESTMNKKYKTQGIILLSIGLLLSPAIYAIVSAYFGYIDAVLGLAAVVIYVFCALPAFISVMCIAFGVGRLVAAAKNQAVATEKRTPATLQKEYQQKKNNLTALIGGTILLAILAVVMLLFVINLWQQESVLFVLVFSGAIPIAIILFAVVMLPINIRNILKQKKALSE
jgi:small-conductance mechanosensitive channel